MQRALIILGFILVTAGLAWPWISKLGLGRLPGDIRIEGEGRRILFPDRDLPRDLGRAVAPPLVLQALVEYLMERCRRRDK